VFQFLLQRDFSLPAQYRGHKMLRLLPVITVISVLALHSGFAASTTDQGQNQLRVLPDQGSGAAPTVSHKHRRGKAVTKNTGQKFTGPTAEFAAAAAYENSRRYDLAIPLYDELVRGGSRARIASNVKFVDGTELRLGATCADEAAHRLEVIATKQLPAKEGASPSN
jgi:hypothetical protein